MFGAVRWSGKSLIAGKGRTCAKQTELGGSRVYTRMVKRRVEVRLSISITLVIDEYHLIDIAPKDSRMCSFKKSRSLQSD